MARLPGVPMTSDQAARGADRAAAPRSHARAGATMATAAALGATTVLAYLDYAGGPEMNLDPLYLLPVCVSAWYGGVIPGAVLAAGRAGAPPLAHQNTRGGYNGTPPPRPHPAPPPFF